MEYTIKPFPGPQEKFLSAGEDIVIFGGSVGGGKDCAVSEEIYTLNRGWILFGDIKEGDIVFDRFGKPSKVLIVSEIRVPSVCYKMYFSNGASITASSDHWWITSTIAEVKKKEESVKTSQEIFDTLMVGDKPNHQLVAVKALRRKSRNLIKYYIKKMEVVASVPCRCITVDSLDSTYLIGRSFIPTHNSFSLLLDIYRYTRYKNFVGVIFRREMKQVVNAGGLWDKAMDLYGQLGAIPNITERSMKFPLYEYDENGTLIDIKEGQGGKIQFGHLNEEKDKFSWQGAEIPYIAFDELTHFSKDQYTYLMSRNRNGYNFPNLIRATCNPDPDSWVRDMLDPWIDSETGYAIPEMAGKRLWMVIEDEKFIFGETKEALLEENPNRIPKSITFIPSKITDNPYLANDESYLASLYSQDEFTRKQLMDGCWNVRPSKGLVFKPEWFTLVDYPQLPKMMKYVRGWDFAAGKDKDIGKKQKFDRTASVKLGIGEDGYIYVLDVTSEQLSPSELIKELERLAYQDGVECIVRIPQDPGQAGVFQAQYIAKNLLQFTVKYRTMNTDKVSRARAVSSKAENGMYRVLRAGWNKMFFSELEKFPPQTGSPDVVDALVEAHYEIATKASYRAVGCKVIK